MAFEFEVRNEEVEQKLKDIGRMLKEAMPAGFGFTFLMFSYGAEGAMFYISSAQREDMIKALREFIQKHEPN